MAYQGHKNWNHWNVALWLANDHGLYTLVCESIREHSTRDDAASYVLGLLQGVSRHRLNYDGEAAETDSGVGVPCTPDGAPYTFTSIRAALVGWEV